MSLVLQIAIKLNQIFIWAVHYISKYQYMYMYLK